VEPSFQPVQALQLLFQRLPHLLALQSRQLRRQSTDHAQVQQVIPVSDQRLATVVPRMAGVDQRMLTVEMDARLVSAPARHRVFRIRRPPKLCHQMALVAAHQVKPVRDPRLEIVAHELGTAVLMQYIAKIQAVVRRPLGHVRINLVRQLYLSNHICSVMFSESAQAVCRVCKQSIFGTWSSKRPVRERLEHLRYRTTCIVLVIESWVLYLSRMLKDRTHNGWS